jgi:hypothetical protein
MCTHQITLNYQKNRQVTSINLLLIKKGLNIHISHSSKFHFPSKTFENGLSSDILHLDTGDCCIQIKQNTKYADFENLKYQT